jgi:pullulanase
MVIDLAETNPAGWQKDKPTPFKSKTDAIIYELHVRDASISKNSGISKKGKFSGLTEKGTKNDDGASTGLDHIRELGVTHVHLLPIFDFLSVDETRHNKPQYNWGYEPMNFNIPEGSYSSDPFDGKKRITELKQLVKAFHENGLRVVMDVVYNHTMLTEDSYFNQLVPGYYYRQNAEGGFSNATACGNEMASERPMMRKFMLESMRYWVEEYHIDGFRVDLMGVHDIETMNIISKELHKIRPDILIYGEGWTAGSSPLPDSLRALKVNAHMLDRIAVFSDDMRDGLKGSVFVNEENGFVSGRASRAESVKFGIVASCPHSQIDYAKVNYSKAPYSREPFQTVNYAECHDNHILWDKLSLSTKDASDEDRKEMYRLAMSIVLTSQGIAFLHAGSEFLRTKNGNENSYNAGDSINAIDWNLKSVNRDHYNYMKLLISLRKQQPLFRLKTGKEISEQIRFLETSDSSVIAYTITGGKQQGKWKSVLLYFNGGSMPVKTILPKGKWNSYIQGNRVNEKSSVTKEIMIEPFSCSIFYVD